MGTLTTLISSLTAVLTGVSAATIVACIIICGYKIMFGGQTIQECKGWIIGGSLIVAASYIATFFV